MRSSHPLFPLTRFSPLCFALLASCAGPGSPEMNPPEEEPAEEPESEVGSFELRVREVKVPVLQGGKVELDVEVVRKGDFSGAVSLEASGLPEGARIADAVIASDQDEITLEVVADEEAPHSLPTAVQITGSAEGQRDDVDVTVTVCGHPGALDTSFVGGRAVVPVGAGEDYAYAATVAQDGTILIAGSVAENLGDFSVVRLGRDGDVDATFGDGGKVMTGLGAGSDVARAIAIQDDGKIVVAGSATGDETGEDFAAVRYQKDGSLDASFGDGGKVIVPLSADSDGAHALLLQADGKIVLAGSANQGSTTTGVDFALVRLNADGSLDEDFGDGGTVLTPMASDAGTDVIYALSTQEVDGAEYLLAAGGEGDFSLARYTSAGQLDASFGTGGRVQAVFGSVIGAARAVRVTEVGHILVAGQSSHDFSLAEFSADGVLNAEFGQGGTVVTPVSESNWDEAQGLALASDGKILVGGWTYEGSGSSGNFALVRYEKTGALDSTFGDDGFVITAVAPGSKNDLGSALVLQADSRVPTVRVLLAGSANDANHDFAVTRYWL